MKIYQLMACGYFAINHVRHTVHSEKVYRSQKQARIAQPDFYNQVTTAQKLGDTMVMNKDDLRIIIHPLELVSNKNKENEK